MSGSARRKCCCGCPCDPTCIRVLFHTYPDVPALSGTEWFLKPVPGVPCAFALVNCEIFPAIGDGWTNITMLVKLSLHPVTGAVCVSYFAGGLTGPGILPHKFPSIVDIHDSPIACTIAAVPPDACDDPMYLPLPGVEENAELTIEFNILTSGPCENDCDVACCDLVRSFSLSGGGFEWTDAQDRAVGYHDGINVCVQLFQHFGEWAWSFFNCYSAESYGVNICSENPNPGSEPDECLLTGIDVVPYYFDGECRLLVRIYAWKNGLGSTAAPEIGLFVGSTVWNPLDCTSPILFDTNEAAAYWSGSSTFVPPEVSTSTVTLIPSDLDCPSYEPPEGCIDFPNPPPETPCPIPCFECNEACGERCWANSYIVVPYAIANGECGICVNGGVTGDDGCGRCCEGRNEDGTTIGICRNDWQREECLANGYVWWCQAPCIGGGEASSDCSFIDYGGGGSSIELGFSGVIDKGDGPEIHFADIITIDDNTIDFDIWFNCDEGVWYAEVLVNEKCLFVGDVNGGCTAFPGVSLAGSDITIDGSVCELVGTLGGDTVSFGPYTCPE